MVDQTTDPLGRIFGIPPAGKNPMVARTTDQLSEIFEANARAMSALIRVFSGLPMDELDSFEATMVNAVTTLAYAIGDACAYLQGTARALDGAIAKREPQQSSEEA